MTETKGLKCLLNRSKKEYNGVLTFWLNALRSLVPHTEFDFSLVTFILGEICTFFTVLPLTNLWIMGVVAFIVPLSLVPTYRSFWYCYVRDEE